MIGDEDVADEEVIKILGIGEINSIFETMCFPLSALAETQVLVLCYLARENTGILFQETYD
jgi:hypothetical protein